VAQIVAEYYRRAERRVSVSGHIFRRGYRAGKPFFAWMNPTRAHVLTHPSPNMMRCAIRRRTSDEKKRR
jgi:hypothetical protein